MKKWLRGFSLCGAISLMAGSGLVYGHGSADPLLASMTAEFDRRFSADEAASTWDIQGWVGYDQRKFWLKSEGEYGTGELHDSELQLLYSQAVTPYWDIQAGVRQDFDPSPERTWGVLALKGLAPYFVETDLSIFVGESGQTALRAEFEYELWLSQHWMLVPSLEATAYGRDDKDTGVGAGLSSLEAGLHLGYQITRKIEPYLGVHWEKAFGNTADMARREGEDTSATALLIGIKVWY